MPLVAIALKERNEPAFLLPFLLPQLEDDKTAADILALEAEMTAPSLDCSVREA